MSKFWNSKIRDASPYVAGEQPRPGQRVIKLNTNENPYRPSPDCSEAIRDFDIGQLRLYPNTDSISVCEAVAELEGLAPGNVFVGNGSDEVLALCFQTFFEKKGLTDLPVLTPEFSYSFYPVFEDFYDINPKMIPLREGLRLEPEDYIGVPNCGIVIANPNAPTSRAVTLDSIKKILDANPDSVVIIDEAYAYFMEPYETAASLVPDYPNLVVVRTLSKSYSLAGLRVGYAIASEELIEGLTRCRDSFNSYPVGRLEQAIAVAAIRDQDYHKWCRAEIIKTRAYTVEALEALGFDMPESSANFVFARPPKCISAEKLYQNLKAKGILVRYFKTEGLSDRLRITIGTREQMEQFIEEVKQEVDDAENI
ncbi:MAG: histidinol-phosphate transaminase [Saccharofermentans sp.]|nr:histidinol-phosphate transaminase [Saccharofermentans sp.]